ncbi:MAG: Ig-like domain-containing protein, partial [Oscillospiraceae bacterium]|nr:Ig-like domain-containing protein [Oscillospiraceae bacterium]
MKRVLSLILALAMLISLVPAVSADGESTQEYSGVTVKYGMVSGSGYDFSSAESEYRADTKKVTFADTNGFWSYHSASGTISVDIPNEYALRMETVVNDWVAIKIYVPKAGKYDITLGYSFRKSSNNAAQKAGAWIVPLNNAETGKEHTNDEIAAKLTENTALTTALDYNSDTSSTTGEHYMPAIAHSFPEPGVYLVVYKALEACKEGSNVARMYPGTIVLDGKGEDIVPMLLSAEVDKTAIAPNGGTAQMTVTAVMSDGSVENVTDKVTYSAAGNATVSDTGLITGGEEGEATVTATLAFTGGVLSASKTIKVANAGAKIFYDIGYFATAIGGSPRNEAVRQATYKNTDDFYQYYDGNFDKENTTTRYARPRGDNSKGTGNMQIASNVAVVYEVYIPVAGTYTMEMKNGIMSGAKDVRVYLSTIKKLEEAGGVYTDNISGNKDKIEASLGTYIGSYPCDEEGAGDDFDKLISTPNKIQGFEIPEAGYYTIAFWARDGAGSVGDFWLTSGTGDAVPMKKSITVNEDGEASVSILLSDKSYKDLSGATITWKSSDTSVADIGKNDGIVDVYAIGETELTAEIYFDGVLYDTVKDTYKVTQLPQQLPCADTIYTYNFFETISPEWAPFSKPGQSTNPNVARDTDILGITDDYTDGTWEWFGAGPNNFVAKNARYTSNYLRIYPGAGRWYGLTINVPTAGKYAVDFEYYARTVTTANANIYIVPKPQTVAEVDSLLTKKTDINTVSFLAPSKDAVNRRVIGTVDIEEKGEYVLVFEQGDAKPSYFCPRILRLDGINTMKLVSFTSEGSEVAYGKTLATSITARLLDGTLLDKKTYSVLYESSNPDIATVDENGVITGRGHGEVTITATVSNADSAIKESIVINAIDDTDIIGAEIECDDLIYVGGKTKLSFVLSMKSGNKITIPAEGVTYTSDDGDALKFDDPGYVTALAKEKGVVVTAVATFRGEQVSAEKKIEVVRDDGKTEATYYTTEKRATALENIAAYDWAKSMKKSAEKAAETYVQELDSLYDIILAEGLPRSTRMGGVNDPYYNLCRYCDGGINKKGSNFITDVISRPWKTQCPDCKRLFPSNDFEGFYKLGLDREGAFDRIRALEAHRAMLLEKGKSLPDAGIDDARKKEINEGDFLTKAEQEHYGFGVDGGYLVNKLYPELSDPAKVSPALNNSQGLRPGEDWKTWGVDDGWGYVPLQPDGVTPYKYSLTGSNGIVQYFDEKHIYVAHIVDRTMKTVITDALDTLKNAYLYTGDIKYGRTGAILLDRIADVYHTYDMFIHNDIDYNGDGSYDRIWYNTEGGSGIGLITGRIDSNNQAQILALCADAFYPVLSDTQVIDYLSEKAKKYGYDTLPDDDKYDYHLNYTSNGYVRMCDGDCREYEHEMRRNDKSSSHDIWKNWENGIIRKNYWGVKCARIEGNFGQSQATTSINAIVQDRQPETTEMLEWIYQPAVPDGSFEQGGDGVTSQLIDVIDRDGMGHESSTNYNRTQIEGLGKMADFLADYKDGAKYNLYENPKFREMFMAFVRPVTPPGHPHIGDTSTTLSVENYSGDIEIWKKGFKELRDTDIADELAQYIWTRNGRTTEGLHYDIFTEDPESFEEDIAALIDETGKLESDLMAGWGFAVLRDGGIYDSVSASTEVNNMRDFWITAGDTDGHGHPDSLELNVDAYGLNLGADLAYPEDTSYTPNRLQWVGSTLSHNTVLINQKNSIGDDVRGFPLHFNDSGMVKLMDIDATHKYAEAENYRRSLVMVKINDDTSYGVDFFRVTGGNHHTYVYHSASSKVNEVSGLNMATEPELIQVDKDGTMDYATYAGKDAAYVKNPDGSVRKALPGEEVDFETVFPVTYGQDPWTQPAWSYETMFPRGYTWLRNVRRAAEPQNSFTVDFEITDYKKVLSNPKGIHLRMTQVNDFTPTGVAFAGGHVPQRSEASKNIGYKDRFDADRATMLEYVYVEREAPEGQELDSLFTTVY